MVNIVYGIKNVTDKTLHSIFKKILKKESANLLNYSLKLYKSIYELKNTYVLNTSGSIILCGYSKQLFSPDNCIASVFYYGEKNENLVENVKVSYLNDYYDYVISFLLNEVFIKNKFNKISIEFPGNLEILQNRLSGYNFIQEGLLNQRFIFDSEVRDGKIFSLQKCDFEYYSTGYIKYKNYNLKIRATNYAVFGIEHNITEGIINKDYNTYESKNTKNGNLYIQVDNAKKQIREYFEGVRYCFDFNIQLPEVSEFQKNVWELCLKIPYGETKSYEDIAKDINGAEDNKKANYSRAVGMALSKNPVLLAIPCHRVIGKDGKLRGFSAGIDFKDFLLKHEMQNLWSIK